MAEGYREQMEWQFAEFGVESRVESYLEIFPELKGRLSKFGIGIFRWNMTGAIDINNPEDVKRVRLILKVLDKTPGVDFFDQSFNGCAPEIVCEILGIEPKVQREETNITFDYVVFPISTYAEARALAEDEAWCIVKSEEIFKEYIKTGNRFYFIGNAEWWKVPCIPGQHFPYDRFGYSLIAIEMSPDNEIISVTSRWNEYGEKSGNFLTESQLKELLGDKFKLLMAK